MSSKLVTGSEKAIRGEEGRTVGRVPPRGAGGAAVVLERRGRSWAGRTFRHRPLTRLRRSTGLDVARNSEELDGLAALAPCPSTLWGMLARWRRGGGCLPKERMVVVVVVRVRCRSAEQLTRAEQQRLGGRLDSAVAAAEARRDVPSAKGVARDAARTD